MIPLINEETGQFDTDAINARTLRRAISEWGGENFPQTYWVRAKEWAQSRARDEQLAWRRKHGLPDDSVMVEFHSYAPDTNE